MAVDVPKPVTEKARIKSLGSRFEKAAMLSGVLFPSTSS